METGDDMEFPHAFSGAARLVQDILDAHLVRAGLALAPAERAELASVHADVRRIDVHVPDEIDAVPVLFLRDMGGHAPEREEIVGLEKLKPVFSGKTLVGYDFFFDFFDGHAV